MCCEISHIDVIKMTDKIRSNKRLLHAASCQLSAQGSIQTATPKRYTSFLLSVASPKFTPHMEKFNKVLIPSVL